MIFQLLRQLSIAFSITLTACAFGFAQIKKVNEPIAVDGRTMGTTYHAIYFDELGRNFRNEIDSLLLIVNRSISNYDTASEVSLFNSSRTGIENATIHFITPLRKALEIASASAGAFEPTVYPLVHSWGFGPSKNVSQLTKAQTDSILEFVGFEKMQLAENNASKSDARVQLDFGGIGQGYGADVIAHYLRSKGIKNFLVELGGEGVASGLNLQHQRDWQVGILDPHSTPEDQIFKAYVSVADRAYTTSGNYFNYRVIDGRKYGHTIDPNSGYPTTNELLSVSVFAKDCTTADAWATAFMAMGLQKTKEHLSTTTDLDAILIFSIQDGSHQTFITPGIKSAVRLESNNYDH